MQYEHSFDEGLFDLVVRVAGPLSFTGMLAGRERLLDDPRMRPGMTALYDYADADGADLTADDVRALATSAAGRDEFHFRALALSAPEDREYGFLRMFVTLADVESVARHHVVVRSAAEAEQWLESLPRE